MKSPSLYSIATLAIIVATVSQINATTQYSGLHEREVALQHLRHQGILPDFSKLGKDERGASVNDMIDMEENQTTFEELKRYKNGVENFFVDKFWKPKDEECKDLEVEPDIDLKAYVSKRWYVHQQSESRYSPKEQNYCLKAEYGIKNPKADEKDILIEVYNYANRNEVNGREESIRLEANVVSNGKLAVGPSFIPKILRGPYWIVAYNEEEGYALITGGQTKYHTGNGLCSSKNPNGYKSLGDGVWIFTRTQERDQELINKVRDIAVSKGIDPNVLNDVQHEGCVYENRTD